ncbi:MAG: ABC transporter substrate-binding protein [Actinomycetota bacterium]|nr:ABC transporter substrate-binding protein [Actinomycetota bacterium]
MRGWVKVVVAVVALTLAATGCSGDKSEDGGTAAPDGILRIGLERPQSLDPAHARFPAELLVVEQLFDGLVTYDPETLQVRPALATRWEATPDQKSWTFFLRPDAKFSNGRTITATDVQYTLDRIGRRDTNSPSAAQLETIAGFKALNVDGKTQGFEGITVPSPGAIKIELATPLSSFAAILGHPAFGIVPREAVEAENPSFATQPIGSGPFMIRSRSADVLRLMPAPGARMALTGLEIHMGRDSGAPYAAFLRGRLDWTAIPAEQVEQVVRDRGRESFRPYPAELFYGFNLRNRKFQDARFREAILRAIDREAIVRGVYGGRVRGTNGVVAQGIPGYQPDPCSEKCRYDPGRARVLLEEVFGSRPVPEIFIDYDEDPTQEAVAQAMHANLRAVGIPATLRPHQYTEYLRFATSGQQELFRLAWIGAYPSPDAFLAPLFYTGHPDNVTGFSSEDFDALIREARESGDESKRLAAYQQAEKALMSQVPVVPIAQYETHTLVSSRVRDLTMSAFGTFDAARVRLIG